MRPVSLLAALALAACADADPTDLDDDETDETDIEETDETDEETDETDDTDVADTDDTDAAPTAITLSFAAKVDGQAAACGTVYEDLGTAGTDVTLKDFRLFVHGVRLLVDGGAPVPLTLDESAWQHDGVALLDFEDATGPCQEFGTAAMNASITGTVPAGTVVTGVAFEIGVPFAQNHLDPAGAPPAPLDASGMFWAWRSGYKYLRIDLLNEAPAPGNGWFIHLGAGGCVSDAPTVAPDAACAKPNVPTITVDAFDPSTDTLVLDAGALIAAADVAVNTEATPPGCMSGATEPAECDPVFDALGLDYSTGACVDDCADQTFASKE